MLVILIALGAVYHVSQPQAHHTESLNFGGELVKLLTSYGENYVF